MVQLSIVRAELPTHGIHFQDTKVFVPAPGYITIVDNGYRRTLDFSLESDTASIPWHETDALHVVDCTGQEIFVQQAMAHFEIPRITGLDKNLDHCGAMDVLIARPSPDVP